MCRERGAVRAIDRCRQLQNSALGQTRKKRGGATVQHGKGENG